MRIEAIAINKFAPFGAQKCTLGAPGSDGYQGDVHILVGENGTGKTRLLSLLMAACGNPNELTDRTGSSVQALVVANTTREPMKWFWWPNQGARVNPAMADTVLNNYPTDGKINVPPQHYVGARILQAGDGTAAMAFRSVAAVREEKLKPMGPVDWGAKDDMLLFSRSSKDSTAFCHAVLNMKIRAGMYLAGNPTHRTDRTIQMIERLEKTLEGITGRPFIFLVEQDGADVYPKVVWGGVRMRLHQLPDGLRAILGWLATCVVRLDLLFPDAENPLDQPILLFIDEPETQLHPAWQRKVIPALKTLLPKAQIFVATHSPFVVSSVNEGWIYVLKADKDGTVTINGPTACSKGDTYIDAVEDALGLKEWYDPETEGMLTQFRELRDKALKSRTDEDKAAMTNLAQEIAKRSESLELMMGRELAQFNKKEKKLTP